MNKDTSTFEGEFHRLLGLIESAHAKVMVLLSDRDHVNDKSLLLQRADEEVRDLRDELQDLKSVWSRVP